MMCIPRPDMSRMGTERESEALCTHGHIPARLV